MAQVRQKDEPDGLFGLLGSGFRGTLAGLLFWGAAALILSAVLLRMEDPDGVMRWLPAAVTLVGAMIGGLISVRTDSGHSMLAGLLSGSGCVIILLLASFLLGGQDPHSSPLMTAFLYAGCMLAALIGGMLGRGRTVQIREGKNNPAAQARKKLRYR